MKSNNAISETLVRSASKMNSQRSLGKEKGSCLSFSNSKVSDWAGKSDNAAVTKKSDLSKKKKVKVGVLIRSLCKNPAKNRSRCEIKAFTELSRTEKPVPIFQSNLDKFFETITVADPNSPKAADKQSIKSLNNPTCTFEKKDSNFEAATASLNLKNAPHISFS